MVEGIIGEEYTPLTNEEAGAKLEEWLYYPYLVRLRDSGVPNMWGGAEYLAEEFDIPQREASRILVQWIQTLDLPEDEQPNDGRNRREA